MRDIRFSPMGRNLRGVGCLTAIALFCGAGSAHADPTVEFDFPKLVECRDVTSAQFSASYPDERVIEAVFPISVRFHGDDEHKVHEISLDIDAAAAELRVLTFSPETQVKSDHAKEVRVTTTTETAKSLDATLGGAIPVPYGELVAHVAPSVSAGQSQREISTETTARLPPKQAIVVSGTRKHGQGVFFELKRSTQSTLQGVHPVTVAFVVPSDWQASSVQVACQALGYRKLLWVDQPMVWGEAAGDVSLYLAGNSKARQLAEKQAAGDATRVKRCHYMLFARPKVELADFLGKVAEAEPDDTAVD